MENNNFENILQNIQKIPQIISKSKDIISKITVVGESGVGLIKVKVNGKKKLINIEIEKSLMSEDKSILQDLILLAINNANEKIDVEINSKMANLMKEIGIPENFISMIPFIAK